MIAIRSAFAPTRALVHPTSRDPSADLTGTSFTRGALGYSAVAIAAAPFFLVFVGLPTPVEALIFALALVPIAAATIVVRSGRLVVAHVLSACSHCGIAAALAFGIHAGFAAAYPWLALAGLEITSAFDKRASAAAAVATTLLLLAVVAVDAATNPDASGVAFMAGMAVLAAIPTGQRILRSVEHMRRASARDAARNIAVAHALQGVVIGLGTDGFVEHASEISTDLLGVAPADLAGRGLFEHILVVDRPAFMKLLQDAAAADDTRVEALRLRSDLGSNDEAGRMRPRYLWVEVRARRIDPGQSGVVLVLRDITAERQQQNEAELAKSSVESVARSKTDFLANMSHELRTPLNAIIGFSEMLGSHTLCPADVGKQREYARIIHQSGQHLLSVVNAILDMSKLQSGTFPLVPEPFPFAPLVEQCCDMVQLKAREGSVELTQDVANALEDIVGDRRAAKQILLNLLSNAVKFTPKGGRVDVSVRLEGTWLRVAVADTGIGIAEADLRQLGAPFFQARATLNRPYEGTGLGLSVVRGLVDLHGGRLIVESELGKGTTATVLLPVDCRVAAAAKASLPVGGEASVLPIVEGQRRQRRQAKAAPDSEWRTRQIA